MISEKIELLGKGLYVGIPDILTLKSIPTASELETVGAEDFDKVMIEKILPASVEEKIDFYQLFDVDYRWVCRCLRIVNYGPYYTTDRIFCGDCGKVSWGEYQVNLNTIACKPIPEGFKNPFTIEADRFIDQKYPVEMVLPTMRMTVDSMKDKAFKTSNGDTNRDLARLCYTIKSIAGKSGLTPLEIKLIIQNDFTPADYMLLKETALEISDFGIRMGGKAQCPACQSMDATFIAFSDDRFFRPTVGDLLKWKSDRSERKAEDAAGASPETL